MSSLKINRELKLILIIFCIVILIFPKLMAELEAMEKNVLVNDEARKITAIEKGSLWYEYEPKIVTLRGTLIVKSGYGPPNYGETPEKDEKVRYHVLKLDEPINVKGDPNNVSYAETFERISEIQIVIWSENIKKVTNKINKKIMIKGTLFPRHTGHHYTDILIKAREIELINDGGK